MNAQMVSPEKAKAVARRIFTQLYRDQGEWFDLAWKCYAESGGGSQTGMPGATAVGLGAVGGASDVSRLMDQQFADLAATFLIHSPMARHELLAKLQNKLGSNKRPDALVNWLVQSAKATLDEFSTDGKIIVNRLHNGVLTKNRTYSPSVFEEDLKTTNYDIVVNEFDHVISVKNRNGIVPSQITKVAAMQRGMLWLVFTKVGGLLAHQQIGDLFDFDATEPSRSDNQKDRVVGKIYQYPSALGEMVGKDLFRRMMASGASRANVIPKKGWSFIWGRVFQNEKDSELLHGLRETARWNEETT